MIPTPDLSHLTQKDYDLVYEPAGTNQSLTQTCPIQTAGFQIFLRIEDTFILLDALEQDADELRRLQPSVCLEVGWVNPSIQKAIPDERTSSRLDPVRAAYLHS